LEIPKPPKREGDKESVWGVMDLGTNQDLLLPGQLVPLEELGIGVQTIVLAVYRVYQ
jgi:hypothetical protein